MDMKELRFAMFGAGFWARYQLAGWQELPGVRCVAIYNRTRSKADQLAASFKIPSVYDNAEALLQRESVDFVDIVTDVNSHAMLTEISATRRIPVICQKPMAPRLEDASAMVQRCRISRTPFYIHENWRWQAPLRRVKQVLDSGVLGSIVRARIDYANSFPVFDNQPFLKELKQFILTDIGTHILDVARFLFGEMMSVYCHTRCMRDDIAGEDVATVLLRTQGDVPVTCNMSYASRWELDRFPETFVAVEGTEGGVSLGPDYQVHVIDATGSHRERVAPREYSWADPQYALIHASIVDCNRHLLGAIQGEHVGETTGADNLRTLQLVFAAYESADQQRVVTLDTDAGS